MRIRPGARSPRIRLGLLVTVLGTAGCAPAPAPEAHTVEYYRAHTSERQATVQQCANDPGRLAAHPACVNAREAERREGIGSLRDLPPMGLPTGPRTEEQRGEPTQ